ncbi:hypothetical protein [Candidatus Mycoplasma haematohominis]|uniref:hypothetical protein n=1 Tax=Candidatus Mycoplasma haematohominis TaxID=1494318 RepID=UPI001C0A6B6D|nr:hypothetical protein [Candidatus Mycoplasma haemohominis]
MGVLKLIWSLNKLCFLIAKLIAAGGVLTGLGYLGYAGTRAFIDWIQNSPEGKNIVGGIKSVVDAACEKIAGEKDNNKCLDTIKNKVTGKTQEKEAAATSNETIDKD